MTLKNYTLKVKSPEYWDEIHNTLCGISSCEHIPNREIVCVDDKNHSPTRGTFSLHKYEADSISKHPYIDWIELSPTDHRDAYPDPQPATPRFKKDTKIYRDLTTGGVGSGQTELNRTNWAIKRIGLNENIEFWTSDDITAKYGDVNYSLTGKNVDIIIHDSGVLQYHPEFLDSNGKSRVRDVVLDGPYYIDPDYFITNNLTYIKSDGRTGITTASALSWWSTSGNRSPQFSSLGTFSISASYTENSSMGTGLNGSNNLISGHGTACAALSAGKNFGLAFEANIWNMPAISDNVGMGIEQSYDLMKIFHTYKPINQTTGIKNPTVINGSWGYQAAFSSSTSVTYKFRNTTGIFTGNSATTNQVTAMKNGLNTQVSGAFKSWSSSSRSNSTDEAGNELMQSGVIYVAAAGNNNQRLGIGSDDPDRLNYMRDSWFGTTDPRPEFASNTVPCNHRDWMNPQGIGFNSTNDYHPVICVGAMDDTIVSGIELKASYSNNGPGIDVWSPADETLTAGTNGISGYTNYTRVDDNRFFDTNFNGTSAAAPVISGLVALYLQTKPSASSIEVKNWLKKYGSKVITAYRDDYSDDTTTEYWTGSFNMRGAEKRISYNPYDNNTSPSISGVFISGVVFTQS